MSVPSARRYLSLWLRRFSTDRIERRLSAQADAPRIVVATVEQAQRVCALNDAAARLRLKIGMPLADVRAMYPGIAVAEADAEADRNLLEAVADWCDRYTPLVALDALDGLVFDVTGCAHLFGGETELARDLVMRLARQGFHARAAVADTVGCAWAVARYGDFAASVIASSPLEGEGSRSSSTSRMGEGSQPVDSSLPLTHSNSLTRRRSPLPQGERARDAGAGFATSTFIVPPGKTESAILPLPLAALRVDADVAADLATMGLHQVGDLASRPRAPFAARFGKELLLRLDRALGRLDEPIAPRLPVPAAMAEQRFPDPIAREDDVLGAIERLARRLAAVLERRGEGGRLFQVALFRADGKVHRLELGTGAPLRDPVRVRKLFEERLAALGEACDPGFGYDTMRLSALVVERSDPAQTGLAAPDRAEELAHLIDRLGARFGLRRVNRLVPQDTHIPEFAVAAVPAHAVRCAMGASSPSSRSAGRGEESPEQDLLSPTRPIRLFERPEPIEAVAQVPDGPPVRFCWRRVTHRVVEAEGPERIAMEWWRDGRGNKMTRDYFCAEIEDGARVWLYREGLYGRETSNPRWYLHGLFA